MSFQERAYDWDQQRLSDEYGRSDLNFSTRTCLKRLSAFVQSFKIIDYLRATFQVGPANIGQVDSPSSAMEKLHYVSIPIDENATYCNFDLAFEL